VGEGLVAAIDSGTTGTRAMVFDADHGVVAAAYEEFPQLCPRPGWVEHDPQAIWRSTRRVLRRALGEVDKGRVCGLGITNQRETALMWDRETGRPVHNAIVWQCRRTAGQCEELRRSGLGPLVRDKTGLPVDPYFSATKWRWLLEHVPEAERLLQRGRLVAGTVDVWLLWKLTGGRAHATEPSNASRTSLFNTRSLDWDAELCDAFGVPAQALPQVRSTRGTFGQTDPEVVGVELPVLAMIGDQQAAAFAQGCFTPEVVKNTYGTGLFMLCNTGRERITPRRLVGTVAWSWPGRTDYALEGSVFTGGAVVQWLRDGLGIINDAAETAQLASSLADNDGVYFVPALSGLGAPYWDPHARGTLLGLTRGTTRAHIVRAALEAMAYRSRDVLEAMAAETGRRPDVLRVDGGAIENEFLMQFVADVLGVPVEVPAVREATALGAAALAGIEAGLWADEEDFIARRRVQRRFVPQMSEAGRKRLYARWLKALERAGEWA